MATQQNIIEKQINNEFEALTRFDIECNTNITYEQAIAMSAIFKAIERLSRDQIVKDLCNHGALQASLQANDIDDLRERVINVGIISDLV